MTVARHMVASLAWVAALAMSTELAAAGTVTKAQCIDANTKAQDLRRDGKLSAARDQLRICTSPVCPGLVRSDCTKRLDELESAQPTIVFDIKDGAGHDLGDVSVTIDGRPLADKLDGTALQLDPGEHEVVFHVDGQDPVTQRVLIKESEKARRERVVVGAPPPPPAPAKPAPPADASDTSGTRRLIGVVSGGAGLAGLATGSIFGILTASAINTQKNSCASATDCKNYSQAASAHSTWTTDGTVSTVAFIAGGALLVAGAALFFTAHPASEPRATTGLVVVPAAGPGGAGMLLKGVF